MLVSSLIIKKRDGGELSDQEIQFLIEGFCRDEVADYQMSALAMAICLRGMSSRETTTLTKAMLESGDRLPRSERSTGDLGGNRPRVDKHSTGGLGDKVSLILAPLLAACGVDVPMISGRGLGLTGGTLDKLESIDGFKVRFSASETARLVQQAGACIVSASEQIAPADRRLYGLRDVTGTVESIPLITASILSKKLAANLDALVMDVKVGEGAFMQSEADAVALANSLVAVGSAAGLPTTAILSDMDQPLGQTVGNAIEVNEAIEVLQGKPGSVRELTIQLCADVLVSCGQESSVESASGKLNDALDSGHAMERFERMVSAQGGTLRNPLPLLPKHEVIATESGYVEGFDCRVIGETIVSLGGGRRKTDDVVNHQVGVSIHQRIGDQVEAGEPIFTLHAPNSLAKDYAGTLGGAIKVVDEPTLPRPLVLRRFPATPS